MTGKTFGGLPWERVPILMLLPIETAMVCIVMRTTLTRDPERVGRHDR